MVVSNFCYVVILNMAYHSCLCGFRVGVHGNAVTAHLLWFRAGDLIRAQLWVPLSIVMGALVALV